MTTTPREAATLAEASHTFDEAAAYVASIAGPEHPSVRHLLAAGDRLMDAALDCPELASD